MGRITSSRSQLRPDPKFDSLLASKFINCLMWDGKKSIAQGVFYRALDEMKKRVPDVEPIEAFTQAVENVKPYIEVRSKRVGGASYQVPMQVSRARRQERSSDTHASGRRIGCRIQPRRRCDDQARQHAQDGRREQSVTCSQGGFFMRCQI